MSLRVNRFANMGIVFCLAAVFLVLPSCSSDKDKEGEEEGAMPLERRQWLGTWHVTDCQEGCNDIFCIPQNTLSFVAKEVQELTLRFEENHRTRSRKQCAGDSSLQNIQGQWTTQGNILVLYNAFGLGKTLIGGYNFLGNGDGLSFLAKYEANLDRAILVEDLSNVSLKGYLLEYGPRDYRVGRGRLVGLSPSARTKKALEAKSSQHDIYMIPAKEVMYSLSLQRYDREVKVNIPENHLQDSQNLFSGCE